MGRHAKVLLVAAGLAYLTVAFLFHAPDCAYADEKTNTETAGDIIHVALPVIAFGSTFFVRGPDGKRWDREGTHQAFKGIGTSVVTTAVLKEVGHKVRPNESNNRSFPSGHTSFAFSGAGFIDTRYGHKWGIPALLAAAFVGYSRVYANAHFADDALAGASVGLMSSWLFTTPQSESRSVALLPMVMEDGAGLQLTFLTGGSATDSDTKKKPSTMRRPRFRYNFAFGPAYLEKNEVTAPSATGTTFDLDNFNKDEDPVTTAVVELDWYLDDRNEILFLFAPFESIDKGFFINPVSFAGFTFPANTLTQSSWRQYDVRAWWRYNLTPKKRWEVKVGAGLFYQDTEIDLVASDGSAAASARDQVILPYVHGSVGYKITPKLTAALQADGIYLSDDSMLDARIFLNYRITERWDFSLGYDYYSRDIETSELTNKVVYNIPFLAVAFSWL